MSGVNIFKSIKIYP